MGYDELQEEIVLDYKRIKNSKTFIALIKMFRNNDIHKIKTHLY